MRISLKRLRPLLLKKPLLNEWFHCRYPSLPLESQAIRSMRRKKPLLIARSSCAIRRPADAGQDGAATGRGDLS